MKEFRQEIRAGRVNLLRMDSVAGMTELPDAGIDFLYIDTNHTYQTTKRELETAHVKVRSSGFIAGHDFSPGRFDEQNCCFIHYGVIEAVREFMKKYDYDLHYLTLDEDIPYSFALKQSSR